MDISPFIQTAFGAIVGGGVVIATNWLNTARQKRKEVQEWYEQRYVTEGLDPLIVYLTNLGFRLMDLSSVGPLVIPDATVPVEALTRLEVLLGINGGMEFLSVFITDINTYIESSRDYQDMAIEPVYRLCRILYELRQEVLERIPKEIHRKNQKLNLDHFHKRITDNTITFLEQAFSLRQHRTVKFIVTRDPETGEPRPSFTRNEAIP